MHLVPLYACFPLREGLWSRRRPSYGICNSKERNTPDNLKRLGSITKQISTTTYNTYDSLQFNSHRSFRGKKESKKEKVKEKAHAFVLIAVFPRRQNETSSVFSVARSEKRGRACFKKGVGINYPTQETCRTSGYCLGLVSILVMYWQTLPLISSTPGVIKKQGPYRGPIGFWITAL